MYTWKLDKNFKELHNTQNDECPICGKQITTISPIVKLGNVAYCMECYSESQSGVKNIFKRW